MLRWIAILLLFPWAAQSETVVAGLSQNRVSITANFDGSEILIFGAVKREAPDGLDLPIDVIIAVEGPSEPVMVRRKEKWFGIWVNRDAVEVDSAPSFYKVATTGRFDEVLSETEDLRHNVSIERAIRRVDAPQGIMDAERFTEALIRIRKRERVYQERPYTVILSERTLFRSSVALPANLTEGNYKVRIFLTREGNVIDAHETKIYVRKVGLERFLYNLSREQPLLYGIMSLAIAIAAGWLASAVFRYVRS
ncbi:putative transmembrane protein [Candidatus Rhodobacter oscarellae]|uniref:Putative transmembrane protein n=1 Tax=Candidatus Rhodobacter oscarellae TaxID=1675527 RepID=A0A0J9ECM6_9RHOB|nr:TIGR02186 family protein [Candidatus Rhodobacter lobularis]KMW60532.1 putative transmembrane protein [Candidatus Rhodobacter lobularis]